MGGLPNWKAAIDAHQAAKEDSPPDQDQERMAQMVLSALFDEWDVEVSAMTLKAAAAALTAPSGVLTARGFGPHRHPDTIDTLDAVGTVCAATMEWASTLDDGGSHA